MNWPHFPPLQLLDVFQFLRRLLAYIIWLLPIQKYSGSFRINFKFPLFSQNTVPDPVLSAECVEENVAQNLSLRSSQIRGETGVWTDDCSTACKYRERKAQKMGTYAQNRVSRRTQKASRK